MTTIAISNHKGGCGKTETTRNIAACLAHMGKRVLVIDLDDQGNMTEHFGYDIEDLSQPCITNVLLSKGDQARTLDEVILPTDVENVYLVPCNITFDEASPLTLRTRALRFAIEAMETPFDFILLDCPPNLKIVTENAFLAADRVIIPVEAGVPYVTGILRTKEAIINSANAEHIPPARWHILLNRVNKVSIRDEMGIEEVTSTFQPEDIFQTMIPDSVKVGEARQLNQIVTEYAPKSKIVEAYHTLLEEIIHG